MDNDHADTHSVASSLSRYEQSPLDSNPLAAQIIPLLPLLEQRIRSAKSWRIYEQDIKHFLTWLAQEQGITQLADLAPDDLYAYHAHLRSYRYGPDHKAYSHNTINRMFSVMRKLLDFLTTKHLLATNPCEKLAIRKMDVEDETTHVALDEHEARLLLKQIDTTTLKGKRDYCIVSLLMRTGLRRDECRMLSLGDLYLDKSHHVALIRHGKGDKPGRVKIPPDVWRKIEAYMDALPRSYSALDAPLFISFRKGDTPSLIKDEQSGQLREARIDVKAIETLVKTLGQAIGVHKLTPHGLRSTFITLAMENGATLEQTQYAARHKDPRMTERYRKRKFNLDNNAVDKLAFLATDEEEEHERSARERMQHANKTGTIG